MAPIVEENHLLHQLKQTQATPVSQKKPHTRLQLNPNAPLFGSSTGQAEQPGAHPFIPQGQTQGDFNKQPQQPTSKGDMFLPQGFQQGQSHEQPSSSAQQNQYQGFNFIPDFSRAQGQGSQQSQNQYQSQQQSQGPSQSEMMPPGLGIGQGARNQMNYPYFPQQMFNQQGGDLPQKNIPFQSLRFDEQIESRPGQQSDINFDKGGYGLQEEIQYQNPDTYQPDKTLERRGNRPPNLYTAVLSGRKMDDSATNSPSVHNMQSRFFSAAPTPTSEFDQAPILNSPNDFLTGGSEEETTNPPLSEEMVESFRLEDHLGELVEFAKTYNGSR